MPDYQAACLKAHEILSGSKTRLLPLDLNIIIASYSDVGLLSYTQFAATHGLKLAQVIENLGSDHGTSLEIDGKTLICFNDRFANPGAVRFTCAHELGHYLLGHLNFGNDHGLDFYHELEKEANCFARNLLMPQYLVVRALKLGASVDALSALFGVSMQAVEVRLNFLETDRRVLRLSLEDMPDYRFSFGRVCSACFGKSEDGNFCTVCGLPLGDSPINYLMESINYDDKQCIMCGRVAQTNDTKENVCECCGFSMLNVCIEPSCSALAARSALHCTICGSPTSRNVLSKI